uniref:uncharacterized protein LOC105351528 n=1 Tax=Fragaria vesca subsp. vesca TaxID=101020 RepID=UPI0005C9E279|nr:PREDICTED: uncharacterized protein LOC105351528 [Fragaria vesca subsp. vesca]
MPSDASCEDIEIDKNLSFLDGYVQQAIEKGAQPYISENERAGMLNINNFRNHDQPEALSHSLRLRPMSFPNHWCRQEFLQLQLHPQLNLFRCLNHIMLGRHTRLHHCHLCQMQDHHNLNYDLTVFRRNGVGLHTRHLHLRPQHLVPTKRQTG